MTPSEFVSFLGHQKVSAILRTDDRHRGLEALNAAIRGGFRVVEVTLTTPGALDLIREFASRPGVVVGAGTVLDVGGARAAVGAGARYLVSPVVDLQVIAEACALDVAMMPGAHTPTEMLLAHRAGAPLVKLFPAPAGGPTWLRSVLGPMPFLRIVPTNGVDPENLRGWLEAGAYALGFVGSLFEPSEMARGDWDRIEARARAILERVSFA